MFFIVGAGFGVSYSMTKINVLDWNRTSWPKKAIRMIIAGAVQSGIYYLFEYFIIISRNGAETFFYKASCRLLQGYLVLGPLVLLFVKIGLIDMKNRHFH